MAFFLSALGNTEMKIGGTLAGKSEGESEAAGSWT